MFALIYNNDTCSYIPPVSANAIYLVLTDPTYTASSGFCTK